MKLDRPLPGKCLLCWMGSGRLLVEPGRCGHVKRDSCGPRRAYGMTDELGRHGHTKRDSCGPQTAYGMTAIVAGGGAGARSRWMGIVSPRNCAGRGSATPLLTGSGCEGVPQGEP